MITHDLATDGSRLSLGLQPEHDPGTLAGIRVRHFDGAERRAFLGGFLPVSCSL